MAERAKRILVTGEGREARFPDLSGDVEWVSVPVLRFEALPIPEELLNRLKDQPFEWIIFTSKRGVEFFTAALTEKNLTLPTESQIACVGESTADYAMSLGYSVDFYPTEPGSECFLTEFSDLLSNNTSRPSVLMPMAEEGRPLIRETLENWGCEVRWFAQYQTQPRAAVDSQVPLDLVAEADAVVFTSPSSVDAFRSLYRVAPKKWVAMGNFTAERLKALVGETGFTVLPSGDLSRIEEVVS